ncbi:unnamed protein product [Ceratitis capitata]|nr:unnamed protein product [Ceratitis capitata]
MNVPENAVRHKIRILRTIFFHVHKKHKRSKTIPKWRYYKRLLFLVDPSYAALPPSPLLVPIVENIDTQEMSKKTERADISEEDLVEPEIISTDTELNSSEDLCEVSNIQKLEESNVIAANEKFGRYVVESINNLEDFRLMKRTKARIKLLISEVLAERAMTQLAECGF